MATWIVSPVRGKRRAWLLLLASRVSPGHGGHHLAGIAQAVDVRVGNFCYYFKTKDDNIATVMQERVH